MAADPPIITLTTDFGLRDEYVGVMKGVLAGRAPQARIIDLCHAIPPQDIRHAAYLLQASRRYFPPAALHVAVVDPGVGSARQVVLLDTDHGRFLAPDNGVLTLLLAKPGCRAHAVTNQALFLQPTSATFHGRDLFAPVAAALANGADPATLGPPIDPSALIRLPLPQPRIDTASSTATGEVVAIDRFGNLITNLQREQLAALTDHLDQLTVHLDDRRIGIIHTTYADAAPDSALALIGSRDSLEIAVNQGNAARELHATIGSHIRLTLTCRGK
ncbi:MAG TPA: SAM-dependent chlorinase/fluorinase [Desulfurivibrionaceae bacterium]|nr:SAM-dependent chlorinase/fluorinase [Desulfurivibrionaceae bacterium]